MKTDSLVPETCTLIGAAPRRGRKLTRVVLQQRYADGRIIDDANVAFLKFGRDWFHLCFECATIFWRRSSLPLLPENDGLSSGMVLNDLSAMTAVVGHSLQSMVHAATVTGDVRLEMRFSNRRSLCFDDHGASDSARVTVDGWRG